MALTDITQWKSKDSPLGHPAVETLGSGWPKRPCTVAHLLLNARGGVKSSSVVFFPPGCWTTNYDVTVGFTTLHLYIYSYSILHIYLMRRHFITSRYITVICKFLFFFFLVKRLSVPWQAHRDSLSLSHWVIGLAAIIHSLATIWLCPVCLTISFGHLDQYRLDMIWKISMEPSLILI